MTLREGPAARLYSAVIVNFSQQPGPGNRASATARRMGRAAMPAPLFDGPKVRKVRRAKGAAV